MKRFADAVTSRLDGPVPSRQLCREMCRTMSEQRGRPIGLHHVEFPPGSATGLMLVREHCDTILVDSRATGPHEILITGHELGHLLDPEPGRYVDGAVAAARMLAEADDVERAWSEVLRVAARNHAQDPCEERAEAYGEALASRLLPWLADGARGTGPGGGLAGRISASLGPR